MSTRTFKVQSPHMKGDDVRNWQREVKTIFASIDIDCPIDIDGDYGVASRAYTASLCYALGINAEEAMKNGVTPELRIKLRHKRLTSTEKARMESAQRVDWRRRLRKRYAAASIKVHRPVTKIIEDSWGYHPGVHDGLDVICPANANCFAMVKSKIIDVRSGGWWGLGAPSDPNLKAKGDGIIQMEVLETVGPFKKGYHIGYGHNEHAVVRVGEIVAAGDKVGRAGFANAWHIHLMVNTGNTTKGIGNLDPRPLLDYAVAHG